MIDAAMNNCGQDEQSMKYQFNLFTCHFYPRDAMLARVIAIATCQSVCLSVCPSRAGMVSKRRKLAA